MTTPNVNSPVMIPAGGQEITSGRTKGEREDQSFMDVLSMADSAAKTKAPEKNIGTDIKTNSPKETKKAEKTQPEDVKKDSSGADNKEVRETAKTEKKENVREDSKTDNTVKEAVQDIKEEIEEKLDISDEELIQVMETLGLTMTDLLDPKTMTDIVAAVKEVTPVDILSDDSLSGIVTDLQGQVREITSDTMQKLDMTPEEFKNTLAELKNEYEVVSPLPETKENTQDLKVSDFEKDLTEVADRTEVKAPEVKDLKDQEPRSEAVRTPAEAVKTEELQPDRTERISDEDKGSRDVNLNVTVKDQRDQGDQTGNSFGSRTSQDDITGSEGRVRHTEPRAETAANNNNIFFQNLNTAVENTLEAMTGTEASVPGANTADAMNLINQISSQIRAVIDNETQSLSMQLHPQSLGRLNVELISKAGQLTAQFEAENASVKAALETRLVELKETLEQRGVRVENVEVTVASHEFEQNLMGGEQSGAASEGSQGRGRRTRSINLNDDAVDGIDGEDTTEEEKIARDMMAANGNSVDFMA